MRSRGRGKDTSPAVEILNVSPHGIWILVGEREFFLSREDFPWFADATIAEISNVESYRSYLRWPDLDVDLAIDSLQNPEKFPLKYRG